MVRCLFEDSDGMSFWKSVEEDSLVNLGFDEGSVVSEDEALKLGI